MEYQAMQVRNFIPNAKRQSGLSLWGYLWILLGVAAAATLILRLGPHYLTHRTVQNIVDSLSSESVHQADKRDIREKLAKRFQINGLYDLDPKKMVEIDRTKERTKLILDYEVREHVVANADVVLKFHDEFQFQ
ncbi:MAG: DUF4845 domain-containing protein [Pseudomonadales bacterium]